MGAWYVYGTRNAELVGRAYDMHFSGGRMVGSYDSASAALDSVLALALQAGGLVGAFRWRGRPVIRIAGEWHWLSCPSADRGDGAATALHTMPQPADGREWDWQPCGVGEWSLGNRPMLLAPMAQDGPITPVAGGSDGIGQRYTLIYCDRRGASVSRRVDAKEAWQRMERLTVPATVTDDAGSVVGAVEWCENDHAGHAPRPHWCRHLDV